MDWTNLVNQIGLPLIAVLVPLVIAEFRKLLPKVPSWALPLIAPVLGAGSEVGLAFLAGIPANGLAGAAAGLAGIGIREIVDQAKKAVADHGGG